MAVVNLTACMARGCQSVAGHRPVIQVWASRDLYGQHPPIEIEPQLGLCPEHQRTFNLGELLDGGGVWAAILAMCDEANTAPPVRETAEVRWVPWEHT